MSDYQKFIRFTKVDSRTREVSGIVTGEAPDKDFEVCDYEKSKPYFQSVISEIGKATDGMNFFPLREMHGPVAAGKCIGFHFNDPEKEVEMTFKVVDDNAWKKVEERVYTGFSQGGRKVGDQIPDPVFKGCMRYVANPSEISLVDNPCYPGAHFQYVKADGTVELRKFLRVENPAEDPREVRIRQLEVAFADLKKSAGPAAAAADAPVKKTKKVGDKDLEASSFAYVSDLEKTETWNLPVHDAAHVRLAIAASRAVPSADKVKVRAKIAIAAKAQNVNFLMEELKIASIRATLRKAARVYVNRNHDEIVSPRLLSLDTDLGKLSKGMYEVSRLAKAMDSLAELHYAACCEQQWEVDETSELPPTMAASVTAVAKTFLAMVDEETRELLARLDTKAA